MRHKMIVILAAALLCVTAWAVPSQNAVVASADGDGAAPARTARISGDVPAGYSAQPAPAAAVGEPPQFADAPEGAGPAEPKPLWGPDVTVFAGDLGWLSSQNPDRMIAYDQTASGTLFSAFTVETHDTIRIYRSTDGGLTWPWWKTIYSTGNTLSSLELVVAEGDSSFLFCFFKSSVGNGNAYVARWGLDGSAGGIFAVKADADTIANLSACRDLEDHYYLYVAYETRDGAYNMWQLRSTDYGKTWGGMNGTEEITDTRTPPRPDICCGSGGKIYTVIRDLRQSSGDSASFRLKFSPNRGDTWYASTEIGSPAVTIAEPVVAARHTSGIVWLVHARNLGGERGWDLYSYSSVDSGGTWVLHAISTTNDDERMPSIASNLGSGAATLCYEVTGESIMFTWASSDTNWTAPIKVSDHQATGFFPPQAGWMYAGGNYSCVLYSGYTAVGLYFDGFDLTGVEEGHALGHKPTAPVARPSPAFNRAVINYTLSRTGQVRVSVIDVAGRDVAVLAQGASAAGEHNATWNCADVPAGVYLVRVDTGAGSQTGRVVVSH